MDDLVGQAASQSRSELAKKGYKRACIFMYIYIYATVSSYVLWICTYYTSLTDQIQQ